MLASHFNCNHAPRAASDERRDCGTLQEAVEAQVAHYLRAVLAMTGENVKQAARIANINRTHFYKLMERTGVEFTRPRKAKRGKWDRPIPADW